MRAEREAIATTIKNLSRVLGSWIAAIAILVLSLRIVTQMTVG